MTQERISELKDKSIEIIQSEEQKKYVGGGGGAGGGREWNHRHLWDSYERSNVLALEKGEGEKEKDTNNENLPKLGENYKFTD